MHTLASGSPKIGSWNYNEADEDRILRGETYVNIHTVNHSTGEIRGQITGAVVPLDGTQETPPLTVPAHGCGFVSIDPASTTLSYYLEYANLSGAATAQHIHGFAPAGSPAGVKHIIATTNPVVGSWTYPAADQPSITGGQTYFNVHTAANIGGEIRGQIRFPLPPCYEDTNCDGEVSVLDLLAILAKWGPCPAAPTPCPEDINKDGVVSVLDLLAILAKWGPCP